VVTADRLLLMYERIMMVDLVRAAMEQMAQAAADELASENGLDCSHRH